jgi:hypothetical protein
MLEEKIDKLIVSVDCLTAVINRIWQQRGDIKGQDVIEDRDIEKPKTVTREEVHAFCLKLVQDHGPEVGRTIRSILRKRNVELIKDLPEEDLMAFMNDVSEAIK